MTPQFLFYILIAIILLDFCVEQILDTLNAHHFQDDLPEELKDVYNEEEYLKSQAYKKEKNRLGTFQSLISTAIVLSFFFLDGFAFVDHIARSLASNEIIIALLFFGILLVGMDIIMTPFSYYNTFIIEEKFGFNKMSKKIFFFDKLKGGLMTILIGGGLLALIIWVYQLTGPDFWIYAWIIVSGFSLFMMLFYSKLIVPLFNKQTPLEDNSLRKKIEEYAEKVGFKLDNIFIINGSKRSTKANAYFSGFGRQKRITLFDTLINDLKEEEIVAVLAHEVGHYKKKHTIYTLLLSILTVGFTLWLLSLLINNPLLSQALNIHETSFHIGLIVFFILYSPLSELTGFFMNKLSRKFEYQADHFAKETYQGELLISSLKQLSRKSLSNLTPHKAYVNFHYSHPTLLQRIQQLKKEA